MVGRPQPSHRLPLSASCKYRSGTTIRQRIGRAATRRDLRERHAHRRRLAARDECDSHCVAAVADPLGSGFIASLPQPGGNITGVMLYEPSVTGKWLSMLKEIAPQLLRAAFLVNPASASFYNYYLRAAEPLSRSLGIDLVPTLVANTAEIERAIEAFASAPNGGLVLPPDVTTVTHRDLIVAL